MIGLLFIGVLLSACEPKSSQELHLFVAASLREAFTDLVVVFEEEHPTIEVIGNFAGSQMLRVQIEEGAAADVYISANEDHMTQLAESGFLAAAATTAATNELVLAVPAGNPADVKSLGDLLEAEYRVIMAGPAVPAGAYARELLKRYGAFSGQPDVQKQILDRVISFETNVRLVAAKLELGEADAGFVYRTDVQAADGRLDIIDVPVEIRISAHYPMAPLRTPHLAKQFVDFIRSSDAQRILERHGFGKPAQLDLMPS